MLAIWFSTIEERGVELTVLASRLRAGESQWDASSEFFKANARNMHGSSLFNDGQGRLYHFNGMGAEGGAIVKCCVLGGEFRRRFPGGFR
jgi:hypothetical protein